MAVGKACESIPLDALVLTMMDFEGRRQLLIAFASLRCIPSTPEHAIQHPSAINSCL